MSRFRHILVLLGGLFGGALTASAQQYPFLPVPGSPKSVKTLFQDSQGRLWLGGDQVSCFDGARFFFLRDYGPPPAQTYSITEDPGGAIWIGGESECLPASTKAAWKPLPRASRAA